MIFVQKQAPTVLILFFSAKDGLTHHKPDEEILQQNFRLKAKISKPLTECELSPPAVVARQHFSAIISVV